ncbi:MAG TPA: hypothetical protein VFL90_16150 [Methylomirabilota bacterium]|nr:hypothetical protein [Methylomirabilota bacterium]
MRALLATLVVAAAVLGLAGGATLMLERRLATLTPGGVRVARLHYNPFTGALIADDVRAHDAAGREVFRADRVMATASPAGLLGRALALGRVRVAAPHVTLRAGGGLGLDDVAAGLGAAQAFVGPVSLDDLVVADGAVTIEGAGGHGAPLLVRDLDVRLSRLTTATAGDHDMAFAIEMALYGTLVHVTGQPRGAGYALHVHARGFDAVRVAHDLGGPALAGIEQGRGEIDVDVLLADGRALASGAVRLADAIVMLPLPGRPRLRAATLSVALDGLDLGAGTGRIARIDLAAPSLTLPVADTGRALATLAQALRERPGLFVRRVAVSDGTVTLQGASDVRLERVQLGAHVLERTPLAPWSVSARASLAPDAEVSVDGLLLRDLRALDAVTRVQRVPLATWRALGGGTGGWDARLTFDGRLRVATADDATVATARGQAELSDASVAAAGGFRADRIALAIRRLRWPQADGVLDSVVLTRPAFAPAALSAWPPALVTSGVSVVEGEMRADEVRRALHRVDLDLTADETAGGTRVKLSAATDDGRVDVDRVVPDAAESVGLPVTLAATILDEAARATPAAAALPAAALPLTPQ